MLFLTAVGRFVPVVVSAETGQEESWNFLDSSHLKLGTGEDNKATTVLLASIAQGLSLHTDPIQSAARIVSSSWIMADLVEQGTFNQLASKHGMFAAMYQRQVA